MVYNIKYSIPLKLRGLIEYLVSTQTKRIYLNRKTEVH